ncbi:MAG: hypothetical protein KFH87_00335 [Bacteroidetes bacterium]|nr:hypothetical protein [Bacteroidota bacterium]
MLRSFFSALLTLLLVCEIAEAQPCPQPDAAGPYNAGWTLVTVQRGSRSMNCRLYYPSVTSGQNAGVQQSGAPYPMIAFGHGFLMQTSYYNTYYAHLASHGYITIAPQFPDTQHGELALDLLACIEYLRQADSDATHFLHATVDTSSAGVSGHSMGGGASLLAASYDSRIRIAAPMCPAETNPSVVSRMNQISAAVCIIAGSSDGITPVSVHQQPMYNAANPFKTLAVLQGGNHTRCMDTPLFDWSDPGGNMTRNQQQALTRRYMTAAFDYFLKGDTCGGSYSYGINASHPDVQLSFVTGPEWPVELASFSAERHGHQVLLQWITETETENFGFELQRSRDNAQYRTIAFIPGAGSTTVRSAYYWRDPWTADAWYRLRQIDLDGTEQILQSHFVAGIPHTPQVFPTEFVAGVPATLNIHGQITPDRILLVNAAGMVMAPVMRQVHPSGTIPLPPLAAGRYYLLLSAGNRYSLHTLTVY